MTSALVLDNLTKTFPRRGQAAVAVVDRLSLAVPAGQVLGFLGHNGAGKTTTIKMICGLITPTAGQVLVNGYAVGRQHGQAMRQLGAVLEGTRNIYWRLSAWHNLLYFGRLKGISGARLVDRATRLLRELGLWERRHDPVRTFSRGMQQQVAIACALVADPPIVLLDEPTLGLDVQAAQVVRGWVQRLAREEGKTVLLTTHQLDLAQALCDRVAVLRAGRLVADRPLDDLLALFREEHYVLRIAGRLPAALPPALAHLTVSAAADETRLVGPLSDQRALRASLDALWQIGAALIDVQRVEPTLEDVLSRLMSPSVQEEQPCRVR